LIGQTRLQRFSDCARAERTTWWAVSKCSRCERPAYRRRDTQLMYKAYAHMNGDAEKSTTWNDDTASHSVRPLSLTPSWRRCTKICCILASSLREPFRALD
jgi:hypothetical protein